jgi:hypothetical protein
MKRKMDKASRRLVERFAAEMRIRAERRLGMLLGETPRHRTDRKVRPRPQRLAAMDGADFERLLGKWRLKAWRAANEARRTG